MASLAESAAALKALTKNVPVELSGMDELSYEERSSMLVLACANVIVHSIFILAGEDRVNAREGLDALITGMYENLEKLGVRLN